MPTVIRVRKNLIVIRIRDFCNVILVESECVHYGIRAKMVWWQSAAGVEIDRNRMCADGSDAKEEVMKITELAPEHIARFDEWAKKWTQIGLSTEPADFDRAIEAALRVYDLAKLDKPMIILRMGSPLGAEIGRLASWQYLQELREMVPDCPSDEALAQVVNKALMSFGDLVSEDIRNRVMGQITAQVPDPIRARAIDRVRSDITAQTRNQMRIELIDQFTERVCPHVRDQVEEHVANHVNEYTWEQVWFWFRGSVIRSLWDQISFLPESSFFYCGAADAAWASFVSFFRDVVSLELDDSVQQQFSLTETLAMSCGFVLWHGHVLAISDRPAEIHRDAEGRLHNAAGPSVSWRDGWRQYHWRGLRVPEKWVTGEPPSAREVLALENIEKRRAACEIVGWKKILNELDAKVIDEDGDPEIGALLEADLPDSGKERFLKVKCGTGREFVLPVPPHVSTALEANAWTWGLEPYEYRPEVRT